MKFIVNKGCKNESIQKKYKQGELLKNSRNKKYLRFTAHYEICQYYILPCIPKKKKILHKMDQKYNVGNITIT